MSDANKAVEDDLDSYLDGVLDEFAAPPPAPVTATASSAAAASSSATDPGLDDEFARQLASNMEQLFKESFAGEDANMDVNSAMAQLMDTFKELQVAQDAAGSKGEPAVTEAATPQAKTEPLKPKTFQETIAQTMTKLRDSSDKVDEQVAEEAKLASLTGGLGDDAMDQMMKELEGLMSNGDFDNVFGGLMEQLMSKELLYEPMKDLAARYPEWLQANESKIAKDELDKYRQQYEYVLEIVKVYDQSGEEVTAEEGKHVAELMQKMQDCGNPPEEILKELAPGMELGSDGMPKMPGMGSGECSIM
ncbi:hypothetical protein HDU85_000342 [Gaertneriomyces sp. JEL0708]|nr:hypothetical protein HDU85_000342 [Gaertneriomyces sp. JEL0708]